MKEYIRSGDQVIIEGIGPTLIRLAPEVQRGFPARMMRLRDAVHGFTVWEWDAVRGRIILGWLTRNGVDLGTLNDKPFAGAINTDALREGIRKLVSAGPEYEISPEDDK